MADSGPLWGLVGAFGGGIIAQLLNAALLARRDHSAELRAAIEELRQAVERLRESNAGGHQQLGDAIADVRAKVAGVEGVVNGFVLAPAERRQRRRGA